MSSVNKVIILGNLGQDPESRNTNSGSAVTNISVATSEQWKDKNSGEKKEKTTWHKVVFFGRLAEVAAQYLRKGSKVYVEGSIDVQKWQDQSGSDRYTTQIVAREMKMLGGKDNGGQQQSRPQQSAPPPATDEGFDDDIPF